MLRPDNKTPAYDRDQESEPEDLAPTQAAQKTVKKKGKKDYVLKESINSFTKLGSQSIFHARSFVYYYNEKEDERIMRQILSEQEQIIQCPMEQGLVAKAAKR